MQLRRQLLAEFLGTFALIFAGTGAIVIHETTGSITHPGIALTFGLVVLALIYALGDISGAHFNPAVTLGFVAANRFPLRKAPSYILAQLLGAFLASGLIALLFPENQNLGSTIPREGYLVRALLLEIILSWFLMFVILNVSTGAKEKGITAGLAIGSVIALEAMFAGPITGASMNPARSFAPGIISGNWDTLWIYLVGPILGTLLAFPCCLGVREPGCCSRAVSGESNS
jgi:aquaporin NIP